MDSTSPAGRTPTKAAVAFAVYVSVLTAAYYYNLTFIQLGLTDLGLERLGLSPERVAVGMGVLALVTLCTTLVSGYLMDRLGVGANPLSKFRVLFGIVVLQVATTYAVTAVTSFEQFLTWIALCSLLLGTAIPFAFSLLLDLVRPGIRGYAAGAVAGCAFFLAALFPFEWTIESFVPSAVAVLAPVALLLGVLSVPSIGDWVSGSRTDDSPGRQPVGVTQSGMLTAAFVGGVVLLFGAFFVDSLGFVRIIESEYVEASWQSSELGTRLLIAMTHVIGGLAAGVAYAKLRYHWLFVATFVLFAAAQFLYVYDAAVGGPAALAAVRPLLYVLAVSCYTTVAFALWPDLATPDRVGTYTAVGIGIGGWLATFTSTAAALVSERAEIALEVHLFIVGSVSVAFLLITGVLMYRAVQTA
ncbi:MFS transporter [Natronomonas pharaonis]|nr:hypothetical protein [Natronomonas pharaonis]